MLWYNDICIFSRYVSVRIIAYLMAIFVYTWEFYSHYIYIYMLWYNDICIFSRYLYVRRNAYLVAMFMHEKLCVTKHTLLRHYICTRWHVYIQWLYLCTCHCSSTYEYIFSGYIYYIHLNLATKFIYALTCLHVVASVSRID